MKHLISVSIKPAAAQPSDDVLVFEAEASLKRRFANDTTPACAIWRDPIDEVADYASGATADHDKPTVKLPSDYGSPIEVHGLAFSRQSHGKWT